MALPSLILTSFFFFLFLSLSASSANNALGKRSTTAAEEPRDLVRSSCVHASYPDVCIRTLSTYAGPAKTPRDLAQASVKVSLSRADKASDYLVGLLQSSSSSSSSRKSKKTEISAVVSDCVEQIGDSVTELRNTLAELKHLRRGTFRWQMSDAETWVSAALTNEDTCLDGFKEDEETMVDDDKVRADVKRLITNVARVTSNALYLINRLDQAATAP